MLGLYVYVTISRHFFLINDNRTVAFAVITTMPSLFLLLLRLFFREDLRILSKHKTFSPSLSLCVCFSIFLGGSKISVFPTHANEWIDLRECARVCNNNTSRWCHFLYALDMPTIVVNPFKMVDRKKRNSIYVHPYLENEMWSTSGEENSREKWVYKCK